jgi:hypothetical protein
MGSRSGQQGNGQQQLATANANKQQDMQNIKHRQHQVNEHLSRTTQAK